MKRYKVLGLALASAAMLWQSGMLAQSAEQQTIADAATALGGRDRIMAVKTLAVEGGGHDMGVAQALRYDELGLQSDVGQIRGYKRMFDLANNRLRFEATREVQYPFYTGEGGARNIQGLDGDIAFNVAPNGNATRAGGGAGRRVEALRHPLLYVRAALDPAAKLSKARTQGNERLVDMAVGNITLTLAIDSTTKLPTRITWMTDSATMGDTLNQVKFADYQTVGGLKLPTRFSGFNDRWPTSDIRIVKQTVDGDVGDLAAPAAVASAPEPKGGGGGEGGGAPAGAPTKEIAKGLWFIEGTTHHSLLAEFSDHLVMIEAPNNERVEAVLAKAKELRPNKPVTTLIMTHHHSDHSGGNRLAVARGVTEIIAHKSNELYLKDMFSRPHTINPDEYAKKNMKAPKITLIDDVGVLKDAMMTINMYHILDNSHADSMLALYFPDGKVYTQADIYMPNDKRNVITDEPLGHAPWLQNVMGNIQLRKLDVAFHAPIHGDYVPQSQFLESLIFMTQFVPGKEATN